MVPGLSAAATAYRTAVTSAWLWWAGFCDALRLHRCVVYFVYDERILRTTFKCFLLNGVVLLGSALLLSSVVAPAVTALLAAVLGAARARVAAAGLVGAYSLLLLLPAYATSLAVNSGWYREVAERVAAAAQRRLLQERAEREGVVRAAEAAPVVQVHRHDLVALLSEEAYRLVLLAVCFGQVLLAGLVPGLGPALYLLLLSWLYALYAYDYKWALHGVPLAQRVAFFERHWAYFNGFGAAIVLPTAFMSFYVGAALGGLLFPLFIILAADSNPKLAYEKLLAREAERGQRAWRGRLPIFSPACRVSNALLARLAGGGRSGGSRTAGT